MTAIGLLLFASILLALAYHRSPAWLGAVVMAAATALTWALSAGWVVALFALATVALLATASPLRKSLLSKPLFAWFRTQLPPLSATEQEALDAGTVWFDAELFSGKPKWQTLFELPKPGLSEAEQAFIDGPVEALCEMLDEWAINRELRDLPPQVWQYIKDHRFLSMIIPKAYGGLEFSAQANAAVVTKLASRSQTAAVTVMVPNSLGPGELLMHFGTDEQKEHYLPRLATGKDIPCFALTSTLAGSDAASMPDQGVICRSVFNGEEQLGIRISWDKRYITLAPVATVLGLAFRTVDPDGLLGDQKSLGITCALIPTDTPGVEIGRRHIPGGSLFMNGPTTGKDVFIPLSYVIGGPERIGQGWRMLMHCLAAGRAISLPGQAVAGGKMSALLSGAYARIRYQFKQPIGRFEGIQEPLARIGAEAYRMQAAHQITMSALDQGHKPVVLSAILKAYLTEGNRRAINDAMDIHGGKAVVEGPGNYLALPYQSVPVSITVEGANILTRSMIVFGQGAIRCHPYLLKEMLAAQEDDLNAFDKALWGHIGFMLSNLVRSLTLGLTGGWPTRSPVKGPHARYFRRINRLSAAFALSADTCLMLLGGAFKFKERLSGRFADALAHLYLASTTLRRFQYDGAHADDQAVVEQAVRDSLHQVEQALHGVYANFPVPWLGAVLQRWCFPLGRRNHVVSDRISAKVANALMTDGRARQALAEHVFVSRGDDGTGVVFNALEAVLKAEPAEQALMNAFKAVPNPINVRELTERGIAAGVINESQAADLIEAQRLTELVIGVDAFAADHALFQPLSEAPRWAEAS